MLYSNAQNERNLNSQVISFLRFPLCVAVVLIHISINTKDCVQPILYDTVHYLFAQILARVAVPLFFMFSGFLFFFKQEQFTQHSYKDKLLKRLRTLLIPYLFWNLEMSLVTFLQGTANGNRFGVLDFLNAFWEYNIPPVMDGEGIASYPVSIQFWYIRDLMVTCLLSPILYLLIKRLYWYFIVLLGVLWITNCWFLITGLNITALFFFSLGAYCAIYKINFARFLKPYTIPLGLVYLLFIIMLLVLKDPYWNPLRRMGILIGMALTISVVAKYVTNCNWKMNRFLSDSSFFIFAYHVIALRIIGCIVSVSLSSDILCSILYFAKTTFIVLVGLLLFYCLKKWMPRFTALITGGR